MTTIPRSALILGAAGLLPTIVAVVLMIRGGPQISALGYQIAVIYGGVIFSFIGGAWWGLAAKGEPNGLGLWLAISVMPSLLAALVLFLFTPAAVAGLGAAFLLSPAVDGRLKANGLAPAWWLRLRVPLSAGMGLLHLAVAWVQFVRL